MKKLLLVTLAAAMLTGCASTVKYPPSGTWGANVKTLGKVSADSGFWPLSLKDPPPAETYYYALRLNAANKYSVAANQVILDDVTVNIGSEMDGTVRDWEATAIAGQDTNIPPQWQHQARP